MLKDHIIYELPDVLMIRANIEWTDVLKIKHILNTNCEATIKL